MMDVMDKKICEKMFEEGNSPYFFKKFKKMVEMVRNTCSGDGEMTDCCSMMMKKMMRYGEGEESTMKKKKEV